jgi:hypothetical protein
MTGKREKNYQDKKKFYEIEKAIKDSYSEVRKRLSKNKEVSTTSGKQKGSASCFQYYF